MVQLRSEMEAVIELVVDDQQSQALELLNTNPALIDEEITIDCSTLTNHCVCAENFEYFRKPAHVTQCLQKRKCFHCQRYHYMHKDHESVTALTSLILIAAALGKFEVFKYLHKNGCNLETKTGIFELRPLHLAIAHGHFNIFCYLLTQKVDVNATVLSHGTTYSPLMMAVMHKQDDMVRHLLMTRGINVAFRNSMLQSPVLFAVQNNSLELINLLLSAEEALVGQTATARRRHVRRRQLHHPYALLEALKQDNDAVLKMLLDGGCSADYVFPGYYTQTTALILAAVRNSHRCLALLLQHGADTQPQVEGYTASDWAQLLQWDESVTVLNEVIPETGRVLENPENNNDIICQEQVTNEALEDDLTQDDSAECPINDSDEGNDSVHTESACLLPTIAIWSLVQWLDVSEPIRRLVSHGHDINAQDSLGRTSLHLAVEEQNIPGLRTLLQLGACTDKQDACMATPFWHAVFWNKESIIRELMFANVTMECKANDDAYKIGLPWAHVTYPLNETSDNRTLRSPLYCAVKKHFHRTTELLIRTGYDVNGEDIEELLAIAKPETRYLLEQNAAQPKPLFTITRNFVRKHCGMNVHRLVEDVELPTRLKDCLLLRDLIDLKIEPVLVHV